MKIGGRITEKLIAVEMPNEESNVSNETSDVNSPDGEEKQEQNI